MGSAFPSVVPALAVDGVGFAYGGLPVLDKLSFHVAPGEAVALLGPSGCGKSTVLNLLAGFIAPDTGSVHVDGVPVHGPGPDRGMVFQSYALFDWMTVGENIAFSLRCAGRSRTEQRAAARDMAALVGLAGFESAYPYQLSGGMRQRCSLARVLAAKPRVMLMDEPFAAVDVQTREKLQEEILRIQAATGTTIVFVTHSIDEAVFVGHRVLLFGACGQAPRAFSVDLPAPRSQKRNRLHPDFLALRNQIYQAMHEDA
ncbi:ABC transporter ATP-binding protein [Orrella dioscoreae]|uniref:Alkanesulfonates ABC transporter ATP-binding protein / Sulfonate ABC transporter, ATP-binding subunit SsuB n=1 Tax=Orrella dioscoreae TaxID=1851544 RepID=A0A1C3JZH9_9BURK|nr:ABC transporter ATP-binding protein [Orrella dioscoreae]SBT24660.1 Alkanesulfonates ABC transporter ATP-binding protein / Sulfonate ABC transporter, ATP-binding subunit SsuB [Orrella dioscoreae]SOE50351.1 Alkanesulfonates ABC transporter ATP-binding protein / Sulfonate ABC transporter, ATP-binding subunit SsuB [Orrella dioscoreae]